VEGNAEAGIVFTKGEAEAKALALRAEAYRQFNEAAVIQTVLSMLPEIVRAAAEPMGNIDNLTVFSADGASDIVRTTTRTVAEAGTAVKGLTGIDIPALLSSAMGGSGGDGGRPSGAPPAPSGRGGARPRGGRAPRPAVEPSAPAAAAPLTEAGTGARRRVDPEAAFARAGEALSQAARTAGAAATTTASTTASSATTAPPAASAPTAKPAPTATGTDRAIGAPRPAVGRPASVDIRSDTTLDEAAVRLASDLESIPGIERFGGLRLSELERSGPRPLRTLWRIARERVDARYGQMTIGELLDRARERGGRGPSASA
jgi:hypothetical protein